MNSDPHEMDEAWLLDRLRDRTGRARPCLRDCPVSAEAAALAGRAVNGGYAHRIRLYQSNWADAQRLMHRWGEWGHYDGNCTAEDCKYEIELTDGSRRVLKSLRPSTVDWLMRFKAFTIYRWLGGRYSIVDLTFIVQDGAILRTEFYV